MSGGTAEIKDIQGKNMTTRVKCTEVMIESIDLNVCTYDK